MPDTSYSVSFEIIYVIEKVSPSLADDVEDLTETPNTGGIKRSILTEASILL
jgi:hypothetical protein